AQAAAVLRPGDRVRYDGADHLVVALAGTSVRLRSADGAELVVLAGHLMASPEVTVTGGGALAGGEPVGLLGRPPAGGLEEGRGRAGEGPRAGAARCGGADRAVAGPTARPGAAAGL